MQIADEFDLDSRQREPCVVATRRGICGRLDLSHGRGAWLSGVLCLVALLLTRPTRAQQGGSAGAGDLPMASVSAHADGSWFGPASGRAVFWRGEAVVIALRLPAPNGGMPRITVRREQRLGGKAHTIFEQALPARDGQLAVDLAIPTDTLGEGAYVLTAEMGQIKLETRFTLRDTLATSPAMFMDENTNANVADNSALAGLSGFIHYLNRDTISTAYGTPAAELNARYDRYADLRLLTWTHDATPLFTMYPPPSGTTAHAEYLRRLMLGNSVLMRYPSHAGQLYDYDPRGYHQRDAMIDSMRNLPALAAELGDMQRATTVEMREQFQTTTGLEPPTNDECLRYALSRGATDFLKGLELPTRRIATQLGTSPLVLDPETQSTLGQRVYAWFNYLIDENRRRYEIYQTSLHALEPTLANGTSNGVGKAPLHSGGYPSGNYAPLDFRFMSIWDNQAGTPEYLLESLYAAALARAGQGPGQPLWIDTMQGDLNGYHFRNALMLGAIGTQGTGYSMELGNSLASNDRGGQYLRRNATFNQEVAMTRDLMQRFGGLWTQAQPISRVGILLSRQQAILDPVNYGNAEGRYLLFYLLSHVGLPPRFVTEEMLDGELPSDLDTLLVLGQTENLTPSREARLQSFTARGGRVIGDSASTVGWSFLNQSSTLDLPKHLPGHPMNAAAVANRADSASMELAALARSRGPELASLLSGPRSRAVLASDDTDIMIAEMMGGAARFVAVGNDKRLDLAQLCTPDDVTRDQFRDVFAAVDNGSTTSWMPIRPSLQVRPLPGQTELPAIYDLLTAVGPLQVRHSDGSVGLSCDMRSVPGRLFGVYPRAVGPGELFTRQTVAAGTGIDLRYVATDVLGEPLAAVVPIEIRLLSRYGEPLLTLYRATNANGEFYERLPGDQLRDAGEYAISVRQLCDGQGVRLPFTLTAGEAPRAFTMSPVQVRDPNAVGRFLATRPRLVMPVFDAQDAEVAERIASHLRQQGCEVDIWQSPEIVDYRLAYRSDGAVAEANRRVDDGLAFGKVRFESRVDQIHRHTYASPMPGYRFGRPTLLIGRPGTNPLVDGIVNSGLLWTDAAPMSAGGALVQYLPQALSPGGDALVVYAADLEGLTAALQPLVSPGGFDPVLEGVRTARRARLANKGLPRNITPPMAPGGMTQSGLAWELERYRPPRPNLAPIISITNLPGDRLLLDIGRWGERLAIIEADGTPRLFPAIGGLHDLAIGKSIVLTGTTNLTIAWSLEDGRPLWKAAGRLIRFLPNSDMAVFYYRGTLHMITPEGIASPWLGEVPKEPGLMPFFGPNIVFDSTTKQAERAELLRLGTRTPVKGMDLTLSKTRARTWGVDEIIRQSVSGLVVAALRRDYGNAEARLYNSATDGLTKISLNTRYMTDIDINEAETQVAVCGMEGNVLVTDLTGIPLHDFVTGSYPMITPRTAGGFAVGSEDGKVLVFDDDGEVLADVDIDQLETSMTLESIYRQVQLVPLVSYNGTTYGGGRPDLGLFYAYLNGPGDGSTLINTSPSARLDFRWMDQAKIELAFSDAATMTLEIRAAAKPADAEPLHPTYWGDLLALRREWLNSAQAPNLGAPAFEIRIDNQPVGRLTPVDGKLKPWLPLMNFENLTLLNPPPEACTVFLGQIPVPQGNHILSIEALNMIDCVVVQVEIR